MSLSTWRSSYPVCGSCSRGNRRICELVLACLWFIFTRNWIPQQTFGCAFSICSVLCLGEIQVLQVVIVDVVGLVWGVSLFVQRSPVCIVLILILARVY